MMEHDAKCVRTKRLANVASAVIAMALSPFPLADEIVLALLYAGAVARLARLHGVPLGATPWRAFARTTWNGMLARAAVNLAVAFVPVAAAIANATTAAVLTTSLMHYFDDALADTSVAPEILGIAGLRDELKRVLFRGAPA
ncbi:MAG TPA: hypothetical protein VMK42_02585 [Anaeromyxobacteraceae bacterium]|nr:hypothetical protein [Anaeromyxobacteraceae bacterium]